MIDLVKTCAMMKDLQRFGRAQSGASLVRLDDVLETLEEQPRNKAREWQPFATAPEDGTRFDAWCVHPETGGLGCRITDVQMRGDKSGFGFIVHLLDSVKWQYLDARDGGIFPAWIPTYWMARPDRPEFEAARCRAAPNRRQEATKEEQAAFAGGGTWTDEDLLAALAQIADGKTVGDLQTVAIKAIARIASSTPLGRD